MFKIVERVKTTVEDFIEQRDDLLLVASCADAETAMVLKLIEDVEQANASDIFLLFAHEFVDAASFAAAAVGTLRAQHGAACDALKEDGREPYPPIPASLDDPALPPLQRLTAAISYARSLLPKEGDHRLVWAMFPVTIADRHAYLDLVNAFAPHQGVRPWMRGVRVIFRDEPDTAEFMPALAGAPRVRLSNIDMGPEAIEQALREEVEDDELPLEQRMTALLQNALIDCAHGRFQGGFAQLRVLLGHYQHTQNHACQAIVLNAVGDAYHRQKDLEKAREYYECAVPLAVTAKSAVILQMVTRNLGDVASANGHYGDAAQFYDGAAQLASKTLYAEGRVQALEQQGLNLEKAGVLDRAVVAWEEAAAFSRNLDMREHLKRNLLHLGRGYRQLDQGEHLAAVQSELRQLEAEQRASAGQLPVSSP